MFSGSKISRLLANSLFLIGLVLILSPTITRADLQSGFGGAGSLAADTGLSEQEPVEFIKKAVDVFLGIVGLVAVAVVIYGGFLYITSAGDEDKAAHGKRVILYAVIGLVLIGLAAIIVNFAITLTT